MMTLRQFSTTPKSIPTGTSWYLADLGEARGRQDLYSRQSPQKLRILREHALIESAISSNRIEGVVVDKSRIGTILFGKSLLRDRNEEEVRGYREALNWIHQQGEKLPVSQETIRELHRFAHGDASNAGKYKERDSDIIERLPGGGERVRFRTVKARKAGAFMHELIERWGQCLAERWVHPLVAAAAFNLDFLCIHPFRDGNGRVSRLLLLLQCYHLGHEVGRYVSLERLIERNKERYYETLEQSSRHWHQGKHDPWPYVNYVLFILKTAHRELEERMEHIPSPKGAKTELVEAAIRSCREEFTLSGMERACPGVSRDMIRKVLRDLQKAGEVECLGRGPGAGWRRKGNTPKRGNKKGNIRGA